MKPNLIRSLLLTPGLNDRWGIPAVYRGKPGVGKSSVINQVVAELGLHCETVLASLREPSDFLGLPIPNKKGGVEYAPPMWARRAAEAEHAVVFLDEVNTAPPSVQAALLRVILEGCVGDFVLPPTVRFICAMNSVEDAAGGWEIAPPLANRLAHLEWQSPDLQRWVNHLTSGVTHTVTRGSGIKSEEARVTAAFPGAYAQALGEIAGFLQAQPGLLHQQPDRNKPSSSGAWPSHRSWEAATRAIAGGRINGLNPVDIEEVTAGCVGVKAASDLGTWREEAGLPAANDLLEGKATFTASAKRPDKSAAVVAGCAALLSPVADKASPEHTARVERFVHVLSDVGKSAPDVAAGGIKHIIEAVKINCKTKMVEDLLRRVAPLAQVA